MFKIFFTTDCLINLVPYDGCHKFRNGLKFSSLTFKKLKGMQKKSVKSLKTPAKRKGLQVSRYFTESTVSPFDQFNYESRKSVIRNPKGDIVYQMDHVEVPDSWSQTATDVLAQKYIRKTGVPLSDGKTGPEHSIKQVAHRMAKCWTDWGQKFGYFAREGDSQAFYDEVVFMIIGQYAAPNSPQWFNTGLYNTYGIKGNGQGHYYVDENTGKLHQSTSAYERPQPHACFILSVKDDLVNPGGIMDLWVREARIFKYGSGVGSNFSALRGMNEKLSGGGNSSGLMSFLKVGDRAAGAIKSGGTTRRAAKMVCLDMDHPEIEKFITWKVAEEKKVAALIAAGYSSDYEGEAYATVSGQNSNNSVRVPDEFFNTLTAGREWQLIARSDGSVTGSVPAQKLWKEIADAAWHCADPGVQFDTTINAWHTCPEGGRIRASNPCSEYMFLDDTACNLASINLGKFIDRDTGIFDVASFQHACRIWTVVLEISVLMAQFPSEEVAMKSYQYRTLGLGYANLGSLLMVSGIPYDSDEARGIAAAITSIMTGTAYKTSAEMAVAVGPFTKFEESRESMLRVIRNHRYAAYHATDAYEGLNVQPTGLDARYCPDYLLKAACKSWDEAVMLGTENGFRNAQVSVIAPTGTIGLVMDCDTTGVEPDFALVKFKKLAGGGYFKIVNDSVPVALKNLGYTNQQVQAIVGYATGSASFNGAPFINHETLLAKGFRKKDLARLEEAARAAFDIRYLFNVWTLGSTCMEQLGISKEKFNNADFDLLAELGFTEDQIEEANDYVCGTMTVEGAPHLKEEHLPVFDCANRCGKSGVRFIHPHGHIRMMAAVQPFISGAISKTINLPHETTSEEIMECYDMSWKLGLKAVAVYRDGSKLSQPLSAASSKNNKAGSEKGELTAEEVLEAARKIITASRDTTFKRQLSSIVNRKRLPSRRAGFTQKAKVGGHTIFVRTGEYDDQTLGEIFIDMHKEGASFRSLMNCFAIAVSIGLQYGVPLDEFVEKFIFTRFEPSGPVDHPNIKSVTSVIDYIFRLLALEYLGREDLVQVKPEGKSQQREKITPEKPVKKVHPEEMRTAHQGEQTQEYLGNMMGDAPVCGTCGHITVRSGSCYKCLNCGSSVGCS